MNSTEFEEAKALSQQAPSGVTTASSQAIYAAHEPYRHECEVRWLAKLTPKERDTYLALVSKNRGEKAAKLLLDDIGLPDVVAPMARKRNP